MNLTKILQQTNLPNYRQAISIVWQLSLPSMLAQITTIAMQYIDIMMVGNLGAKASASIGLVESSTWLISGVCSAISTGFSVQVAHAVGAENKTISKIIFKESLLTAIASSVTFAAIGVAISFHLPMWLQADLELWSDSSTYFMIFCLSIPAMQLRGLASSMLQCTGNMRTPSLLNGSLCVLDVIFNAIFIFVLNYGVMGAAIGTAVSEVIIAAAMIFMANQSEYLKMNGIGIRDIEKEHLQTALKIALPMAFETIAICGAWIFMTTIIAPLGNVSLAANSFGITAEALCYMPAYGIAIAATTLIGQSLGANKKFFANRFAWAAIIFVMSIMTVIAVFMYFLSPIIFAFMTPDLEVQALSVKIMRVELLSEPLFGASIVAAGALRGAKETLMPSIINLFTIWCIRLCLAIFLSQDYGLYGVWIAMSIELCIRGLLLILLLKRRF